MAKEKLGPCALSRCALEWWCSFGALGMAVWFAIFPEGAQLRDYLMHIPHTAAMAIPISWIVALLFAGTCQMATIFIPDRKYARWAATTSGIVWIYVGISVGTAGLLLLTWHCILMVGAQLYISLMFKA